MAAATLSSARIDLGSKETFPIRLGSSILKPKEARKFTSVRHNYTPSFKTPKDVQSTIRTSKDGTQEKLVLKDGSEEYTYAGKPVGSGGRYVLLCKKNGNDKELVLERLAACHDFNLVKTSTESDSAKLAAKYTQISFTADNDDDLFGDEGDVEEPIDPSNPWDYRNYLKSSSTKPREQNARTKDSVTSTPQVHSRAASTTPVSRPFKPSGGPLISQKKRKATENIKTNPKRVKAGTEPPPPTSAPSKPTQPKPTPNPEFKIEHKRVSQRKASVDNGELVLELATPVTENPPKQPSAMALALSGRLPQGPISLHSAASSPASRVASPNPPRPEGMEDGEEFDLLASSSPETPVKEQTRPRDDDYFGGDGDEDADADADADVEDFELPSPAQTHGRRKSVAATTVTGDDDDDLEQQMMAAMADDDDEGVTAPPLVESDEESEEE